MAEYEIPLSTIYDAGEGVQVEIKDGFRGPTLYVVDRTGDVPHDTVQLEETEAEELVHILVAFLNRDRDGTIGGSRTGVAFEEWRVDSREDGDHE